jgi:octaprenyl-diphosphate synthase
MSRVTTELTVGEMREIEAHDVLDYSIDDYDQMIEAKTASLLSGACEVGVLGANPALREPMRQFGRTLGMAFQIADDLLDYTGSEAVTGKPQGLDLREHKITLPLILALPEMRASERDRVMALMRDPEPSGAMIAEVVEIVERRGGIAAAQARAEALAVRAESVLLEALPPSPHRDALRDCITYVVQRRR